MKKRLLFLISFVLLIALACTLFACGETPAGPPAGGDDTPPQKETPSLTYYSQSEHIGWEKSLAVMDKSAYSVYAERGEAAFVVPGLSEGENFVLQGIEYCASKDWALLCGYVKPDTAHVNSVIFVIDMSARVSLGDGKYYYGKLTKEILLEKPNGDPYTGHAGGIAVSQNTVWLSNGSKLYYFPLSALEEAPATGSIRLEKSVSVPVNASYASYGDGMLWVGEFEYGNSYQTDDSHHSSANKSLTAWTVGYALNETGAPGYDPETGIKSENLLETAVPDAVLWHGSKIQGMAPAGDKIVLSSSYGRTNDSAIWLYENPLAGEADGSVQIGGVDVPYYELIDGEKIVAPPMTEDLGAIKKEDKYYVLVASESSSYYYYGAEFSIAKNPIDFVWKLEIV